ncbi:hypothetical protein [Streptomyces antibioticus]|uniref:hypothetical protein n=1 Tax=Streptomyces antibioticus TaxID=1890 RepID=UPI00224E4CAD|nr:hypothetical protein [Streptomyces antibioticus]MCX4742770.1 hypothetical protein [Streptomyces antibioticus]
MRPAMFGYLRLSPSGEESDEDCSMHSELEDYANREGFTLERVFTENAPGSEHAFFSMVEKLKGSDVKNVIVPSLWHFARLPGLQEAMRQHIEREIGARLWIVQGVRG